MKTPDALQVTAALGAGCTALLTNDDRWPERIGTLRILRVTLTRYTAMR